MKVVARVYARLRGRYAAGPVDGPGNDEATAMRCPRCEAVYADGTEFCSRDGTRLLPDAAASGDPFIGQVLDDRYRIDSVLGRGGMGVVYRAHQATVGRAVAVKVLNHDASSRPEVVRRFENEARIISTLRHPNTLKLIDFGHLPDGRLYIVNPLLEGLPLDEVLKTEGRLDVPRALAIVREVALALAEAHDHGIVHRDLKPANIFTERLGRQELVKVLDFGIAKLTHETTQITQENTTIGTVPYMSPEQVRAEQIDARSDLYSLGCVAYECLVGRPPFGGDSFLSVAMKHLNDDPLPLRQAVPPPPGLDAQIEELVMRCLEKLPEDRPPDAMALVKAVQRIERRLSVGAESEASPFVTLPPTATAGAPSAPPSPITGNEATIAAPTPLSGAAPVPPSPSPSTDSVLAAALPQPGGRRGVVAVVGVLALAAVGAALALRSSPTAPDAPDAGAVTAIATPPPAAATPAVAASAGPVVDAGAVIDAAPAPAPIDATSPKPDATPPDADSGPQLLEPKPKTRRRWRPRRPSPAADTPAPTPAPTPSPVASPKPPPGLF